MKNVFNSVWNRTLPIVLSFTLLATVFSSCKKNDDDMDTKAAEVTVTNASSASLPQDVYFDNQKVTTGALVYTQTAGYFSVSGNPAITFKNTSTADITASVTPSFASGKYYNVFYTDDKTIVIYENDRTSPPSGKARIRFVNLSTGMGSSADFGVAGGSKIASGLTYKAASNYQDIDPSSTFALYSGGSASVLLNLPVTVTAGKIYTLYISGTSGVTLGYKLLVEN